MPGVSAIVRTRKSLAGALCHKYCARIANRGDHKEDQMLARTKKIKEHKCAACNGTGFPAVKQPVLATRKIYPVKCEACAGKGRITEAD
jgi:DnaJ-class molecular chaperone